MIYLAIIISWVNFCSLDFNEVEKRISQVDTYSELMALIENEIGYQSSDGDKLYFDIERALGNNTQQIRLVFITEEYGSYYHLSLVKHDNKLLYCQLTQKKNKSKIIINESEINTYLDYINSKFQTKKTIQNFKSEIDQTWMFSDGCGFSVTPTEDWKKIEKFVNKGKINKIRNYLYSLDIESQTYGIIVPTPYKLDKK